MMNDSPLGLTPLIGVFDMQKSLAFYRDLIGFEVVSASPEVETSEGRFSHWTWLKFGSAELMLNTQYDSNERPEQPDETRTHAHGDTCFYIGCADLDIIYVQLTKRGLLAEPPKKTPYGLRVFTTRDPDGYKVVFQESR
ncbi:MAG TPA: VOC family protein [Edaphobacter sp.]|nr:VOC family protein [Edaphobacter sp.]